MQATADSGNKGGGWRAYVLHDAAPPDKLPVVITPHDPDNRIGSGSFEGFQVTCYRVRDRAILHADLVAITGGRCRRTITCP